MSGMGGGQGLRTARQRVVTGVSTHGAGGGWAAIVVAAATRQELRGCEPAATLDRLELLAALAGLGALPAPGPAELVIHSQRLHQALTTGLLVTWQRAGWRTAAGGPLANADLWHRLARAAAERPLIYTLSRARGDLSETEWARQLAARAAQGLPGTPARQPTGADRDAAGSS